MLHYEEFQATVMNEMGEEGAKWKHLLPAVPVAFRNRFMYTLHKGFNVPGSFDMVMLSQTLTDANYELFVQDALAKKLANELRQDDNTEKVSLKS